MIVLPIALTTTTIFQLCLLIFGNRIASNTAGDVDFLTQGRICMAMETSLSQLANRNTKNEEVETNVILGDGPDSQLATFTPVLNQFCIVLLVL